MGETGVMKEASVEELVEQCASEKVAVRVPAYRTLIQKCTASAEDVVWSDFASEDDTKKTLTNVKTDLSNEKSEIRYEAAGVCGCLLANESFLSLVNPDNEIEIIEKLIKVAKETKEKKVLTRSLWSISKSRLKKNVYVKKNEEIVEMAIGILKVQDTSSVVIFEALHVIKSLCAVVPDEMGQSARNWYPCVFGYMFHDATKVRSLALNIIDIGKILLEKTTSSDDKSDILKMIIPDLKTHHCKQMNRLVEENIDMLKQWRIIVQMLGKELHPGTSLINVLLEVVEKAFKSFRPEIRVGAFNCWKELINNFSLDKSVLTHSKRLKLLLAPLKANNAKTEEVAHAKLLAWWHLVCKLGKKAAVNFDLVVLPLLRFCFGYGASIGGTTVGLAERNLIMSGASASPGRKFSSLYIPCAEILAQILSKGVDIAGLQGYNFTIPLLEEPVVTTTTMFIRYHQLLLDCTSDAVQSLNSQERKPYLLGVFLFQSVLAHLRVIITLDTNKKDCVEPVKALFNTISSLGEQCRSENSLSCFVIKFLEMVIVGNLALPKNVYNNPIYSISKKVTARDLMHGTLSNHLIRQLCKPALFRFASLGEGFFTLWLAVLANFRPSMEKLKFLESVLEELKSVSNNNLNLEFHVIARLWSSVAIQLAEQIEEINLMDITEYDWRCAYMVLLFPIKRHDHLYVSIEGHTCRLISTAWSQLWFKLIEQELTPTAEPNSEVEYIVCALEEISIEDRNAGIVCLMADILATLTWKPKYSELEMTPSSEVHSPAKLKENPHAPHIQRRYIKLLLKLLHKAKEMVSDQLQHATLKLLEAMRNVFNNVEEPRMLHTVVTVLVKALTDLLKVNPVVKNDNIKTMLGSMIASLKSLKRRHYEKEDSDELDKKIRKISVYLRKAKRTRLKVKKGKCTRLELKKGKCTRLELKKGKCTRLELKKGKCIRLEATKDRKSSLESDLGELSKTCSSFPQRSAELHKEIEESKNFNPKENIPAHQGCSLFMCEVIEGTPQDAAKLRSPQVDTSKSNRIILDTLAAKEKSKVKTNLEDMREEDFVKVVSPKLKRRVLTEHQIERMTERRCDIPALYSELSQTVSQDMLTSQFVSQDSFENSAIEEPAVSPLKKLDKNQDHIIDSEDIVKTTVIEMRTELSFSGKFPSESKETEHESEEDEVVKEMQIEYQRKKSERGSESKQTDTNSVALVSRTEQAKRKQEQEVCEAEQFEMKKNLSISIDDYRDPSCMTDITDKVKHKVFVQGVSDETQVETQSKEKDRNSNEQLKNIDDKSEKEELTLKTDNIRTYSGKKKKDTVARKYGNGDSDYTDEDLNEELRKTSLMLQKSLKDTVTDDSSLTFMLHEANRRKSHTPVKKTLSDVRKSLKGTALSSKDNVNTNKIDSPPPLSKQIKDRRINFKEVAVSPCVIRDDKLMKKVPEVKLTDEDIMMKNVNTKHESDTESEEEIPNSQVSEEPKSRTSVIIHDNRESPLPVLIKRYVDEDSGKELVAKEGSHKPIKAKRKCSFIEENETISVNPDKRKKSGDKIHQSSTDKQSSSDDSVVILGEKAKEQEVEKQVISQRKNKENPKQQRDTEEFTGRNVKKVAKSSAELLCQNSQNDSDSQSHDDRPNSTSALSTPPKVTRSGRKIVAPNRDMPEPMTPPGSSSSRKRTNSREFVTVSFVDDDVPRIRETVPIPICKMAMNKSAQRKITDMFCMDNQKISDKEFNENFEACSTLPEMEEIIDSLSDSDGNIDECEEVYTSATVPSEEEISSRTIENFTITTVTSEENNSATADTTGGTDWTAQHVFSGHGLGTETRSELAQVPEKITSRHFPTEQVQVDSCAIMSKDRELASSGNSDTEGNNIHDSDVLNKPLKITKTSKELESAGHGEEFDKINGGRHLKPEDLQKTGEEEVPTDFEEAKCQLATKDQIEKTDDSSSFECAQVVDEHLNEIKKNKELTDSSANKTENIRVEECRTGSEKVDVTYSAGKSDQESEKNVEDSYKSEKASSMSENLVETHIEKSSENDSEKIDNENAEALCVKDFQNSVKAYEGLDLKDFENRLEDWKEVDDNRSDKKPVEASENIKITEKLSKTEKGNDAELLKASEIDLEIVSLKSNEKPNVGSSLPARQWEEELSPERPSKSRLNLAVSTPEREKKKIMLKYPGSSRAAMLVAVAKKNIKNRGTSEGESPSKSVIGVEASRSRSGGSPIRRSATGRFSPSNTPPRRKRKFGDCDSGRPWVKHEPSPGASPSTSILKKKTTLDDSFSRETPSPKRRCVRFTDPLVSDRVEIPPPPRTPKGIRAQKRLDMTKATSPIKDIDFPSPSKESQEADSPAFLDSSQPLFPTLINCQDKIHQVAHLLTSSALVPGLLAVFEEHGVYTVGHLSRLTEADINKLPVRAPKISSTIKILKKYEEKQNRGGKKTTDPLMDEVEAQLCEIFGEVDREDKENLQPNNSFHEGRKCEDGEDDLENVETNEDRTNSDNDAVHPVIDDIHGMDEDITPLDSSTEDVQPETMKAICKKAVESPQFLESLTNHMDMDAKEMLFTHLIKKLRYEFVIDCFYRYLKTKNTGDNT